MCHWNPIYGIVCHYESASWTASLTLHLNFHTSTSLARMTIWNGVVAIRKWWIQGVVYGVLPYEDVDRIL